MWQLHPPGATLPARRLAHPPAPLPKTGAFATFMAFRKANPGTNGLVPTVGEYMASIIAAGENFGLPNNDVGAGAFRPGALNASTTGASGRNIWATVNLTA